MQHFLNRYLCYLVEVHTVSEDTGLECRAGNAGDEAGRGMSGVLSVDQRGW